MVYIETPHLLLRDWKEEDILPFVRMNSDKEVMEFFLTTLTEEETMAFYCRIRKEFEEYGYGLYAVECKETQNFLGYVAYPFPHASRHNRQPISTPGVKSDSKAIL